MFSYMNMPELFHYKYIKTEHAIITTKELFLMVTPVWLNIYSF
jgi:hypothetical protein